MKIEFIYVKYFLCLVFFMFSLFIRVVDNVRNGWRSSILKYDLFYVLMLLMKLFFVE